MNERGQELREIHPRKKFVEKYAIFLIEEYFTSLPTGVVVNKIFILINYGVDADAVFKYLPPRY